MLKRKNKQLNEPKNKDSKNDYKQRVVNEFYLYENWWKDMRIRHVAHIKTNARYYNRNIILGVSIIFLSAVAGSSVLTGLTLENDNGSLNTIAYYFAAGLSVLLAALTAMQTFLAFGDRAKIHHKIQAGYGDLRHDIEKIFQDYISCIIKIKDDKKTEKKDLDKSNLFKECKDEIEKKIKLSELMDDINHRMEELDKERPTIPQRIYDKVSKMIEGRMLNEIPFSKQLEIVRKAKETS